MLPRVDVLASRVLLHPSDFERSRRFYAEGLGLAVFREWGEVSEGGVVFYIGGGLLELSGAATEPPSGAVRLLLQVRDVHAEWQRLISTGARIETEPETMPWGLIEMTVRDPDGFEIVLAEVPPNHPQRRSG